MTRQSTSGNRRGVLLLIVLGMLAVFGLIVTTFLVVTSQARRSTQVEPVDQVLDPTASLPQEAVMQVLRGTSTGSLVDSNSAMEGVSLLEGVYGNRSVRSYMRNGGGMTVVAGPQLPPLTTPPGGQLIQFTVDGTQIPEPWRLVGCVLTMTDGPAKGESTRIVACAPNASGSGGTLTILGFDGSNSTAKMVGELQANSTLMRYFVINGSPFSGMGRSYNPNTRGLDLAVRLNSDAVAVNSAAPIFGPAALLPNTSYQSLGIPGQTDLRQAAGGANVDYTAVDYNTMLVALLNPNASTARMRYGAALIPSLHRPELVRYWINQANPDSDSSKANDLTSLTTRFQTRPSGSNWTDVDWKAFKRRLVLRPLPEDHPQFTGSNPKYSIGSPNPYQSGFNPLWDPKMNNMDGLFGWDVDNDGDGVPDSIWVDLGFKVEEMPDGRLGKPMAAILCVELDGRLNVNAHGAWAHTETPAYYQAVNARTGTYFANGSGGAATATLQRGQGWGVADINLWPLFAPNAAFDPSSYSGNAANQVLLNLLKNRYADSYSTSVIAAGMSDRADPMFQNKLFSYWNDCAPVVLGRPQGTTFDYWQFETNPVWWDPTTNTTGYHLNAYGSPPTFQTRGAVGLDVRGQPIYASMGATDERLDVPYEMDLAVSAGGSTNPLSPDKPYSAGELERIARPYDGDSANLCRRLADATNHNNETVLVNRRHELTTESWDIPSAPIGLPREIVLRLFDTANNPTRLAELTAVGSPTRDWYPPRHAQDVLAIKMFLDMRTQGTSVATIHDRVKASLKYLMPLETIAGLKMDLNRPFGNGLDDNGNGIVDEPARVLRSGATFALDTNYPGEIFLLGTNRQRVPLVTTNFNTGTTPQTFDPLIGADGGFGVPLQRLCQVDVNGDGTVNEADEAMARQLYARHLYILGLLAIDFRLANPTSPTPEERARARMIAQWAVNALDFMDRDSIMTPFEYDIAPFVAKDTAKYGNVTWNVDGFVESSPIPAGSDDNEGTTWWYRGLVWGCEKPELLITETLAFHDRRTQNLDDDGGKTGGTPPDTNNDFDQKLRPQGNLFFELYNPSSRLEPKTSEFYSAPSGGGVNLTKLAPEGAPVWRVTVPQNNTDDPDVATPNRSIYFCDVSAAGMPVTNDGYRHYPGVASTGYVAPGRYALIGPGRNHTGWGAIPDDERRKTYLGFKTGWTTPKDSGTRRIELRTSPIAAVYNDGNDNDLPLAAPNQYMQVPVVMVVDRAGSGGTYRWVRLSVSEPQGGYPDDTGGSPAYQIETDDYNAAYPQPLDKTTNAGLWDTIRTDGRHDNFTRLHLQRLANPALPWDAKSNPYRTVDTSTVDLMCFNGVTGDADPDAGTGTGGANFYSRERGEANHDPTEPQANNLWTQEPFTTEPLDNGSPVLPDNSPITVTGHHYNAVLHHTLGYLNWDFRRPAAGGTPQWPRDATLGADYRGDPPGKPFPWLTWNNRPFATPNELMMVPVASAQYLLAHPDNLDGANATTYPFDRVFQLPGGSPNPYLNPRDLYPNLMNFYLWEQPASGQGQPALMHRVLEYVRVPSLFEGTDLQLNPVLFAATPTQHIFPPPFHFLSTYREPGRINLNTISHANVFRGLLNRQDLSDGGIYTGFQLSRQGYGGSGTLGDIVPNFPTRFVRPFRGSAGNHLNPPIAGLNGTDEKEEVNWTMLRQSVDSSGTRLTSPMFSQTSGFAGEADNPARSAYFRHQPTMRLGNLVTNRSNVFAVWITIGVFEALPAPALRAGATAAESDDYNAVYSDPGGSRYTWGAELGSDTGEVKRRRAFFLIDRTIPAGFSRDTAITSQSGVGEALDRSAQQTILLRRDIE